MLISIDRILKGAFEDRVMLEERVFREVYYKLFQRSVGTWTGETVLIVWRFENLEVLETFTAEGRGTEEV